nr:MAG TPA: hypothetical protein [Caudoviricetes sp.]
MTLNMDVQSLLNKQIKMHIARKENQMSELGDAIKESYAETARAIIDMAEGMTHSQWNKINHFIEVSFQKQEAKLTFEKPKELDLLMKQNFIL